MFDYWMVFCGQDGFGNDGYVYGVYPNEIAARLHVQEHPPMGFYFEDGKFINFPRKEVSEEEFDEADGGVYIIKGYQWTEGKIHI